ncbi:hypothetical protein LIS04_57 [Listeria phage LIS04]|nr:hypothetical protein LIS04_57 [Listeria phage LIS04]
MRAEDYAKTLADYESKAYLEGLGVDWLSTVGEGVRLYFLHCGETSTDPTIEGLMEWINYLHNEEMK